ncbi:DUF6881 domain-containing protein [Xanthomonas vesicatoria]|uniref:DUF6881 domain-containing protein n=1 Tax=Xanthomonas vesicatoria TaxID=56460 RepID=UPI0005B32B08|nr:hypothetical protein [Xanthomonas vesicatoria]APP76214.1 hypothetical protein BJD12_14395 [Xanthomonas vesicatoria ATCC 35937]KTF30670.1 hypothetical protein LMG919_20720 [Xanthomonas vesicatoria]KTF30684.1 hypothetical protein LMG920_18725 [Xanthomonas vesicatoria]MCC8558236.1 hypothetical protein [Xanthomonas vesicatoria]MCC8596874.1 hypothetical protein [Xanthomonas vesicatoria]
MEYIDVIWHHEEHQDPIRLVSELDAQRYEVRKLEFFRSGAVGFAFIGQHSEGTELGELPVPPLTEINASPEFSGIPISGKAFEQIWHEHVSRRV